MVANVLITSCKDNICRIWCETILPDDGLIHIHQDNTNTFITKTTRHKRRIMDKLHKMRLNAHIPHFSHSKQGEKYHHHYNSSNENLKGFIGSNSQLNETSSNVKLPHFNSYQDFCLKHNLHCNINSVMNLGFHFHLAASINTETGITLHQNISPVKGVNFIVNWINNKDLAFTLAAEVISKSIIEKLSNLRQSTVEGNTASNIKESDDESDNSSSSSKSQQQVEVNYLQLDEETKNIIFDQRVEQKLDVLMKDWYSSQDMLYCIHPIDGSILIWVVDWLDEYAPNGFRQAQVSFHGNLPNAIPTGDALTISSQSFLFTTPVTIETHSSVINMVTKHNNGTLNLWRLTFQESSNYQSLLNVLHLSRICGHRYHVRDLSCHPILPILLSNSHNEPMDDQQTTNHNYHAGLIIWRVEPIGPLSNSGGIFEIARIDSHKLNSFENIAWFPCFLPSSTLGNLSNSPSTLFASTDNECITIYQAVLDAKTLLNELIQQSPSHTSSTENKQTLTRSRTTDVPFNHFNVVSIQSTARPGCIIELDKVADSLHNWNKALLFHVYQEKLIVDLEDSALSTNSYNENFFLVLLEKSGTKYIIYMWKITISSLAFTDKNLEDIQSKLRSRLTITSQRVCKQELNLENDINLVAVDPAAADLAASCMFSLSKVPYLFSAACSDGSLRFWTCEKVLEDKFEFFEWYPKHPKIDGFPLAISSAYNGRFAVAFRLNKNRKFVKKDEYQNQSDLYMNLHVNIYECESSGGDNWRLEQSIPLKDVHLPELDSGIDFDYINGNEKPIKPSRSSHSFKHILFNNNETREPEIPSLATKVSIRRQQSNGNKMSTLTIAKFLKRLVQLDWASCENGSHLLTIGLGNKIIIFSATNQESTGLKWTQIRSIDLESADDMQALPVQMKWVRDGLLVIGLDTEMQIYSQWPSSIKPMLESNDKKLSTPYGFDRFYRIQNPTCPSDSINKSDYLVETHGLFSNAKQVLPTLAQYHPYQLLELMNSGRINRVKIILMHLLRSIINTDLNNDKGIEKILRRRASVCSESRVSLTRAPLNKLEIESVSTIPLFLLYSDRKTLESKSNDRDLFEQSKQDSIGEDHEYDFDDQETKDAKRKLILKKKLFEDYNAEFSEEALKLLCEYLKHVKLPGLDDQDNTRLAAIASTILHISDDILFLSSTDIHAKKQTNLIENKIIDSCGLKFVASLKTIEIDPKHSFHSANFAWAFHSNYEEELLNALPSYQNSNQLNWNELKQYGVGWWLKNPSLIKQLFEKLAKCAFQAKNDPLDSALYYLALKKKSVLLALFKTVKDTKMADFFKNDFDYDERWKTASLKNSFVLLGKQRFEHAAAFFLLAGKLKDAVEVCLRNLQDIQLALLITRLFYIDNQYEANQFLEGILRIEVLGYDSQKKSFDLAKANINPFLRSIAFWCLNNYDKALFTLFEIQSDKDVTDVFNFYVFLKHEKNLKDIKRDKHQVLKERQLYFRTAYHHLVNGCPIITLDVLSKLKNEFVSTEEAIDQVDNLQKPKENQKAENFDWSAGFSSKKDENVEFKIEFSDDEDDDVDDIKLDEESEKKEERVSNQNIDVEQKPSQNDIFAQQLMFIACLKIITEETTTLSSGFNINGSRLRHFLYYWLGREIQVLKSITHSDVNESNFDINELLPQIAENEEERDEEDSLHEKVIEDQEKLFAKIERQTKRKQWLRNNELLIRILLGYCSEQSGGGSDLASVHIELVLLIQELIEYREVKKLASPVPPPISIPLLTSMIINSKTIVASPIRIIQGIITDILMTTINMKNNPLEGENFQSIFTMKDLSMSLSACIYQCLCDGDRALGQEKLNELCVLGFFKLNNNSGIKRHDSIRIETSAKNWPGVQAFKDLLDREKELEIPKLRLILFEALISVYISLLLYALILHNSTALYLILSKEWNDKMWSQIFGGSCKKQVKYKVSSNIKQDNELIKHRAKLLNPKLSVIGSTPSMESKIFLKEYFIQPQTDIVGYFISKSDEMNDKELESIDEADIELNYGTRFKEHSDPNSYSWSIMEYAAIKYSLNNINSFIVSFGIEKNRKQPLN